MRVLCVRLISPVDGSAITDSSWLSLHREYAVLSMAATPSGQVQLQVVTDDRQSLGWFDSQGFVTTDGTIPSNWTAKISESGTLEIAPATWHAEGFWEAYYDGDSETRRVYAEELKTVLGEAE